MARPAAGYCCRSLPKPSSVPSSSRSFSARAMKVLARAISAPCSNPSSRIRSPAACCRQRSNRPEIGEAMARNWISLPRSEGETSRQAHADLPKGSYERELGKEGFFGPATHMYHRHPPTGWTGWDGPLKPRAFDLTKLAASPSPWDAPLVLGNGHLKLRYWHLPKAMDFLARNADGDELIFVHAGEGALFCDYG